MQIPIKENPHKWSTIVIDQGYLLKNFWDLKLGAEFCVKYIELCASMQVKNIYTSNHLYNPGSMPKEIQFLLRKNETYSNKYQYIFIGEKLQPISDQEPSN